MKYEDVMTLNELHKIKHPDQAVSIDGQAKALVHLEDDSIGGVKGVIITHSHGVLPRLKLEVEMIDVLPEDAPEPTIFRFKMEDPK